MIMILSKRKWQITTILDVVPFPCSEVKPPFHYYEFVDCCQGWTKLKREDGKYLCRCDGRLYRRSRGRRLRCRPTRGWDNNLTHTVTVYPLSTQLTKYLLLSTMSYEPCVGLSMLKSTVIALKILVIKHSWVAVRYSSHLWFPLHVCQIVDIHAWCIMHHYQ